MSNKEEENQPFATNDKIGDNSNTFIYETNGQQDYKMENSNMKTSNSMVAVSPENGNLIVKSTLPTTLAPPPTKNGSGTYDDETRAVLEKFDGTSASGDKRETWDKKLDFLLSVIGFAVDLGNVWRFPMVCYNNGGGAFLIPYMVMLIFGGLPLFYMELALGQFQRCGCISVWSRICPMFKGIGFGICVIASYVAMYYNTIIAWAVYYMFASFAKSIPWATCDNPWNTDNCRREVAVNVTNYLPSNGRMALSNLTVPLVIIGNMSPAEEYFERSVLEIHKADGLSDVGTVKWSLSLCLLLVFLMVYFSLWKGIKSSGKAVWITATLPYVVLLILLVRGVTLPGAEVGIKYYLTPDFHKLLKIQVWTAAAAQIFFSLGPGFGVLLALSSYNKFHNNCYKDALLTSSINCATSFLAGFVVFSVLGYMSVRLNVPIQDVAKEGPGLVFVVYPEAMSTLPWSNFWSVIFFLMLITLGLDSTFGGLEAVITGVCDEWPCFGRKREVFVAALICYVFLGGLATTTYGGSYVVTLLDNHGAPISILFICFLEAIGISWFYGVDRFSSDLENMLGFKPGIFWRLCWKFISPVFLLVLFIMSFVSPAPMEAHNYHYPTWTRILGWVITCSSIAPILIYIIYKWIKLGCPLNKASLELMIKPEERPKHLDDLEKNFPPTYL